MAEYLKQLRYHVFMCDDAGDYCGCEAAGAGEVRKELRKRLAMRRLAPYVKTTLMTCNQPGAAGPVAVVYPDGTWYEGLTVDDIDAFIDAQFVGGRAFEARLMAGKPIQGPQAYAGRNEAAPEPEDPTASRLRCVECDEHLAVPQHCGQPMHHEIIEGDDRLVCWMGPACGNVAMPQHHNRAMELVGASA